MKFLTALVVIVMITLKVIFGFVDTVSNTVYEGSHKPEEILQDLDL